MTSVVWLFVVTVFDILNGPTIPNNVVVAGRALPPVLLVPGIAGTGLFAKKDNADIPECSSYAETTDWYRAWASFKQLRPPKQHQICWWATMRLLTSCDKRCRHENYRGKFITVAGAFGGAVRAVMGILSGLSVLSNNWINVDIVDEDVVRNFLRSLGSMYVVTPTPETFPVNVPIVNVENSVVNEKFRRSSNNMRSSIFSQPLLRKDPQFFFNLRRSKSQVCETPYEEGCHGTGDAVYNSGNWTMLLPADLQAKAEQAKIHLPYILQDPKVPVYCLWGKLNEATTVSELNYMSPDLSDEPTTGYTFGDGTLPLESLRWCTKWDSMVLSNQFQNLEHMRMISDKGLIQYVINIITHDVV